MVELYANAKINLALEVMEEKDGYHQVNNIMIPISIYDKLTLEFDNDIYVADDKIENNICVKAAKEFISYFNINGGVKITLEKNIPMAAGLAGGSTDAAFVIKGLNELYNVNASIDELEKIAALIGSDVPFFIRNKAALCTNRGEIIHPFDFDTPKIKVYLIKPQIGLSTKAVYQNYVYDNISKLDKINNIKKALANNDLKLLKDNIFNDLNKSSLSISKELNDLYESLSKNHKVFISGSGPTMYILEPTDEELKLLEKELSNDIYHCLCYTI